jgi:hypothetical protein
MKAARHKTKDYAMEPRALFEAIAGMIQHSDKYALDALSNETLELRFHRGASAMQWGQEYLAAVTGAGAAATLTLTCGGRDGRPSALLDGFKNSKAAGKALDELDAAVADGARAPFDPTESFATDADGVVGPWTPSPPA